jgi:uncharacterized protein YbjT (DUF2867 family)
MANDGKILITGATGNVGGATLDRLATADADLRALTRDESKAQALGDRGVEAAVPICCNRRPWVLPWRA